MPDDPSYPTPPDPLAGREDEFGDMPPTDLEALPPVEPPSAGFIVQLFLVPALIVTVVIGVYLLFGRLASGEQDWRKQLTDVRSDNPHVRWRGALGLAQMLQADATADGVRLAENRDVATELTQLLNDSLGRASTREDDLKQQEFLTRTLGLMDLPAVTFPVLIQAMDPSQDREVRKNAIASVATAINRLNEEGKPVDEEEAVEGVIAATEDSDLMIRQLATYALGLFESPEAQERLKVLLGNGDDLTRVNAAVALARRGSPAGLAIFEEILADAGTKIDEPLKQVPDSNQAASENPMFEGVLKLTNTLKAIGDVQEKLDAPSRARIISLLKPIAGQHPDARVRVEAQTLLTELEPAE